MADVDVLLRSFAGRGREVGALHEAAAALAELGRDGSDPAATAAIAAVFGSADPVVLRGKVAHAGDGREPEVGHVVRDGGKRAARASPIADRLEAVAAAVRA